MFSKEELRREMKTARTEYSGRELSSKKISERILKSDFYKRADFICMYMPSFGEADISEIFSDCLKSGKKVCVPVVVSDSELALSLADGRFKKGRYGISEPENPQYVSFSSPNLILVPGLAFDRSGNRLGFGKGYYDRFLAHADGLKVGVCYGFQLIKKLPAGEHDISVDAVITEDETLVF